MGTTASQSSNPPNDPRKFPFPPGIPVLGLLLSWGLGKIWPIAISCPTWRRWLGLTLVVLPFGLIAWAARTFRRHGTVVRATGDTGQVVTSGPFKYTRNPMYLGLVSVYLGSMLLFCLPWALILLLPVFLALHFGIILREEKYLEAKFGENYIAYKQTVRRWL